MPYESPNIVIVPTVSFIQKESQTTHEILDQSDKRAHSSNNIQTSSNVLEPTSMLSKVPEASCKNVKKPCVSWASSYLQSIGQCTKPINPSMSPPKDKIMQKVDGTLENTSNKVKINLLSHSKVKKYATKTGSSPLQTSSTGFRPRLDTKTWLTQQASYTNTTQPPNEDTNTNDPSKNIELSYTKITPHSTPSTSYSTDKKPHYSKIMYRPADDTHSNNLTKNIQRELESNYTQPTLQPYSIPSTSFRPSVETISWLTQASYTKTSNNSMKDNNMSNERNLSIPCEREYRHSKLLTNSDPNILAHNEDTNEDITNPSKSKSQSVDTKLSSLKNKTVEDPIYNKTRPILTHSVEYANKAKVSECTNTRKNRDHLKEESAKSISQSSNSKVKEPVYIKKYVSSPTRINKETREKDIAKIKQGLNITNLKIKKLVSNNGSISTSKPSTSGKETSELYKKRDVDSVNFNSKSAGSSKMKRIKNADNYIRDTKSTCDDSEKKTKNILKRPCLSPEQTQIKRARSEPQQKKDIRGHSENETSNRIKDKKNIHYQNTERKVKQTSIRHYSENETNDHPESTKLTHSDSSERSQKKRVRRNSSESQSPEFSPKKRFRQSSENMNNNKDSNLKNLSPVKSVVQRVDKVQYKHPRIQGPESDGSDNDSDSDFDLRTTLNRQIDKHNLKRNQINHDTPSKHQIEKPRENLVITFKNDKINTKLTSAEPSQAKIKTKKYRKVQLFSNVICRNSEDSSDDSSSDDRLDDSSDIVNENKNCYELQNLDLSFLDDFNIDEIVNSLKDSPERDNIHQDIRQTILTNNMEKIKKSSKLLINEFVQPVIIKSEIKNEHFEKSILHNDNYRESEVLHNGSNNNESQENTGRTTANDKVETERSSNCNKLIIQKSLENIETKLNQIETVDVIKKVKQEKFEDKINELNIEKLKTKNVTSYTPPLHDGVLQNVNPLIHKKNIHYQNTERKVKQTSIRHYSENETNDHPESTKLTHSDSSERSQKKRVRRNSSESKSPEFSPKKRFRQSSENMNNNKDSNLKNLSPVKSVVQRVDKVQYKHPRIQGPESDGSDNDSDSDFDLRTTLNRQIDKHNLKRNQINHDTPSKDQIEKPRENLAITFKNDEINTKLTSAEPSQAKIKTKKYRKVQLFLNVIWRNSEDSSDDSSSDDRLDDSSDIVNENKNCYELQNLDLSFLDDFNIDEIVNSLKDSPKRDNIHQDIRQTISTNNMEKIKKSSKLLINEFVQPVIIKSEIKNEHFEKSILHNDNYRESEVLHNGSNNNESQENTGRTTATDKVETERSSNCNKLIIQKSLENIETKLNQIETVDVIKKVKQEKFEDKINELNIEKLKTKNVTSYTPPLHDGVRQNVNPLTGPELENIQTCVSILCSTINNIKHEPHGNYIYQEGNLAALPTGNIEDFFEKIDKVPNILYEATEPAIICENTEPKMECETTETNNILCDTTDYDVTKSNISYQATKPLQCEATGLNVICDAKETNIVYEVPAPRNTIDKTNSPNGGKVQEENNNEIKNTLQATNSEKLNKDDINTNVPIEPKIKEESTKDQSVKALIKSDEKTENKNRLILPKNTNADTTAVKIQPSIISGKNKDLASKLETRILNYLHLEISVNSLIHTGKFSTIFKSTDKSGKNYAVKILKNECDYYNLGIRKEKMIEKIQKDFPKENLNTVYFINGFGLERHWCFLMEYYPKNLKQALQGKKPFHVNLIQNLARQLFSAVIVLRNNNIVHSDIKPSHILLDASSQKLKVCGFDRCYYVENVKVLPNIGTIVYRAPEVILGFSAGFAIDVWSTALIIYEMATGHTLFQGKYNNDILYQHMCLLGNLPADMVLTSPFAVNHFWRRSFMRIIGSNGQHSVFIHHFYKTNTLQNTIFTAYNQIWGKVANTWQRVHDLTKLESMHSLLQEMLALDPRRRLPIEFAYAHPFSYKKIFV